MEFSPTAILGVYLVESEPHYDGRGFFARAFCKREFEQQGLKAEIVQCNISHNTTVGTLRGLHYQKAPHEEAKIVQCVHGSAYDVVVDLRPDSATHKRWFAAEISADNHRMLYIPAGCAHGFQTLCNETMLLYYMMNFYAPDYSSGVRWDDPAFGIDWPQVAGGRVISPRDAAFSDYLQ